MYHNKHMIGRSLGDYPHSSDLTLPKLEYIHYSYGHFTSA